MAAALREITGGAAILKVANQDIGRDPKEASSSPTTCEGTRNRVVDRYAATARSSVINIGDEASVTAPLAEWSEAVLQEIFQQGTDGTSDPTPYMGLGRRAGSYYEKKRLDIAPIAEPDDTKAITLWACCPTGEISVMHDNESDRILSQQFIACIDETQEDGELIGKIYVGVDRGSESACAQTASLPARRR